MKLIPLKGQHGIGKFAKVSDEDFEVLSRYTWYASKEGYAWARILMHRLVLKAPRREIVDHANGDSLDNQASNLRRATAEQSSCNTSMRKSNRAGYKGVSMHRKHKLWRARIQFRRQSHTIGYFEDPIQAAMAYDLWAHEIFGEFANVNFKGAKWGP